MKRRLREGPQSKRRKLWSAAYILMGLRYEKMLINRLLEGVMDMEESVTYQAILEKGELRYARRNLLRQGQERFGRVPAGVRASIEAMEDFERLDELSLRLLRVDSWQELLGFSNPPKRRRR